MRFFDPADDTLMVSRRLPHWSQDGTVVFITWRTHDSMPQHVLRLWRAERNCWLRAHGIEPSVPGWKFRLQDLKPSDVTEFHRHFTLRWHRELDVGYGECQLRRPDLASIVADSLRHFDGDRYELLDFVVMPNHVHMLATFPDKARLLTQCESWKHFMSTRINRILQTKGRFWQQDAFDHLVRQENQFRWLQRYIAENPKRAGLREGESVLWSSGR